MIKEIEKFFKESFAAKIIVSLQIIAAISHTESDQLKATLG